MRKNVFWLLLIVITIGFSAMSVCATPLYGDLNSDGSIDSLDLTIMKRVVLKKMTIDDITAADLDGDGELNSLDVTLLKRYILKKITKFPVESMNPTPTPTDEGTATPTEAITPTSTEEVTPTPTQVITPTSTEEITPTPTETDEGVFVFKIKTTEEGKVYKFPCEFSPKVNNYNIVVDWGDGTTSNITDISTGSHKYEETGIYTIKVLSFDNMPHVPA